MSDINLTLIQFEYIALDLSTNGQMRIYCTTRFHSHSLIIHVRKEYIVLVLLLIDFTMGSACQSKTTKTAKRTK